jgi:hypothetical protein
MEFALGIAVGALLMFLCGGFSFSVKLKDPAEMPPTKDWESIGRSKGDV